jgi:hypothetical protein
MVPSSVSNGWQNRVNIVFSSRRMDGNSLLSGCLKVTYVDSPFLSWCSDTLLFDLQSYRELFRCFSLNSSDLRGTSMCCTQPNCFQDIGCDNSTFCQRCSCQAIEGFNCSSGVYIVLGNQFLSFIKSFLMNLCSIVSVPVIIPPNSSIIVGTVQIVTDAQLFIQGKISISGNLTIADGGSLTLNSSGSITGASSFSLLRISISYDHYFLIKFLDAQIFEAF